MRTGALLILLLAAGPVAAQAPPPDAALPPPEPFVPCEEAQRGALCTQHHEPVCAAVDNGIRCVTTPCDDIDWHTVGNACSACARREVFGWRAGECPPRPGG